MNPCLMNNPWITLLLNQFTKWINKYLQNLYNNIIDTLMSYWNISTGTLVLRSAIPFPLDMVKLRSFMAPSISIKFKVKKFLINYLMHFYYNIWISWMEDGSEVQKSKCVMRSRVLWYEGSCYYVYNLKLIWNFIQPLFSRKTI